LQSIALAIFLVLGFLKLDVQLLLNQGKGFFECFLCVAHKVVPRSHIIATLTETTTGFKKIDESVIPNACIGDPGTEHFKCLDSRLKIAGMTYKLKTSCDPSNAAVCGRCEGCLLGKL